MKAQNKVRSLTNTRSHCLLRDNYLEINVLADRVKDNYAIAAYRDTLKKYRGLLYHDTSMQRCIVPGLVTNNKYRILACKRPWALNLG